MTKAKKFGTFAGVFTPSILTILGVIMYMRLGWVVGQAGLINTIIIILLAHVISLSTGLSISSIATDKKIKAGGIYYILSRSLGLPMGGAIGIALFLGTALSISLYIIGFAESFLSIEPIRLFLGLEQNIFGYQVVGTAAILILVALAFISTSLAIKTQYYILGAIGLSLVSIFVGFFIYPEFRPESISLQPASGGLPLAAIFAVFFPAVTGFTAGVAMSGDLKNPKKSIPYGTMAAIVVGFVVYIALAIAIALFVNRDLLLNDTNFIMKIAWFSPFVIAGIWGATLSSALGGILGGPRILQAMSTDRISPRLFARGYGINNEPRNALILIFLIAEIGILIGELNVVAGVVSMFYLASYGFINISYFLESWASADFRPSFKINRYIGLIGFIAAFGVMFKLNMGYMVAALVIMLGIYFLLKQKQLKLDYGDVWHSVWSSLIRTALEKMDNADLVERNWQPNIILFSGATNKRPHLIELGQSMVGKHGVLSNFDLVENKKAKVLFPKMKQSMPNALSEKGVFTRRQTVNDIYDGIEMISRTYGFSGIEPNTVMMGWARQTQNPKRFTELLETMFSLDFNVILTGYDKRYGYGDYQRLDIWLEDKSNFGSLALNLSKLLLFSEKWENARIRVLVVNSQNDHSDILYRRLHAYIDTLRVDAQLRIINNQLEQRPFYEIVEQESHHSDLVFLNIPDFKASHAREFIDKTNVLLDRIGTVIFLKASSSFKTINLSLDEKGSIPVDLTNAQTLELQQPAQPLKPELSIAFKHISDKLFENAQKYLDQTISPICHHRLENISEISEVLLKAFSVLDTKITSLESRARYQLLAQIKSGLLVRMGKIIAQQQNQIKIEKDDFLLEGLQQYFEKTAATLHETQQTITIRLFENDLIRVDNKFIADRSYKFFRQLFSGKKLKGKGLPYTLHFRKLVHGFIPIKLYENFIRNYHELGNYHIQYIFSLQKILYSTVEGLLYLERNLEDSEENIQAIIDDCNSTLEQQLDELKDQLQKYEKKTKISFLTATSNTLNEMSQGLDKVPANNRIIKTQQSRIKETRRQLLELPLAWESNQNMLLRFLDTEATLLLFEYRIYQIFKDHIGAIQKLTDDQITKPIEKILSFTNGLSSENIPALASTDDLLKWNGGKYQLEVKRIRGKAIQQIKNLLKNIPEQVELFSEEANNELSNIQFSMPETIRVSLARLVDYIVHEQLTNPFYQFSSELLNLQNASMEKVSDAARIIRLSLTTENSVQHLASGSKEKIQSAIADQTNRVKALQNEIQEAMKHFDSSMTDKMREIHDELHIMRLLKNHDIGHLAYSSIEASQKVKAIGGRIKHIRTYIEQKRAAILHSESKARLFAQNIAREKDQQLSIVAGMLTLKEQLSPTPKVWKSIPYYYQQLFISKYNYHPDFFFGRKNELKDAFKAIKRYKAGFHGAILIQGDPLSGKSFFAEHVIKKYLADKNMYSVQAPQGGSATIDDFENALRQATGSMGSIDEILRTLPAQSVLLIDDLELWWEKSDNGGAVLAYIFALIKKYNSRLFFIVTANTAGIKIIRKQWSIDYLFVQRIVLEALNSGELEELILFRHRTSGFDLRIDKSGIKGINLSVQARIFNRIFRVSEGNAGTAINSWLVSITAFKNEGITIRILRPVNSSVFAALPAEAKLVLLQLVLHRQASEEKLKRICLLSDDKLQDILGFLSRCGLINKLSSTVVEPDQFLLPYMTKHLFSSFDKDESME